jgi:tRNA A-37 threonylcarbamoyl transferase component Bud32
MWKLSDVKRFRPHSHTSMIYEIDLRDENDFNPVVFKRMDNYRHLQWEYSSLDHCNKVGIRAPKILGLLGVGTHWGGCVMTKIDATFCLQDCHPESIKATSIQPALADRKRWFEQISDAIRTLHRDGYVWGDVKPANVLINKDGDACLIDFEGGSDQDWIDYELTDTAEGDLQGLDKLRDFLNLDE